MGIENPDIIKSEKNKFTKDFKKIATMAGVGVVLMSGAAGAEELVPNKSVIGQEKRTISGAINPGVVDGSIRAGVIDGALQVDGGITIEKINKPSPDELLRGELAKLARGERNKIGEKTYILPGRNR
jgi:hypothetical protein